MKRNCIFGLLALIALLLASACSLYTDNIPQQYTSADRQLALTDAYAVKAADNSGRVALYESETGDASKYVPDGTELEIDIFGAGERVRTNYEDILYWVNSADLDNAAIAKIAQTQKIRETILMIIAILVGYKIFSALVSTIMRRFYRKKALAVFGEYYTKKRQEHPWLDQWIKDNGDPTANRGVHAAVGAESGNALMRIGIFILFTIVFCILFFAVLKITPSITIVAISYAALYVFLLILRIKKIKIEDPSIIDDNISKDAGMPLECPVCKCPHSWEIVRMQHTCEGESTTKTTTTTKKYDVYTDGSKEYAGTDTDTTYHTYYYGETAYDYLCHSCNHTERKVESDTWDEWPNEKPQDVKMYAYDPDRTFSGDFSPEEVEALAKSNFLGDLKHTLDLHIDKLTDIAIISAPYVLFFLIGLAGLGGAMVYQLFDLQSSETANIVAILVILGTLLFLAIFVWFIAPRFKLRVLYVIIFAITLCGYVSGYRALTNTTPVFPAFVYTMAQKYLPAFETNSDPAVKKTFTVAWDVTYLNAEPQILNTVHLKTLYKGNVVTATGRKNKNDFTQVEFEGVTGWVESRTIRQNR